MTAKPYLILLIAFWYLALITNFDFNLFYPEPFWRVFNQMLQRLLEGRFDMDPKVVRLEGYLHNGLLVSYWGILPALLRLPFSVFVDLDQVALSRLSCWVGLLICAWAQMRTLLIAKNALHREQQRPWLLLAVGAALLLTGPQLTETYVSWVYQEPIIWSAAIAMTFNFLVFRAALNTFNGELQIYGLAALVGLAFLCRVTTGMGLLLAFAIIVTYKGLKEYQSGGLAQRIARVIISPTVVRSILILTPFAALVAWINQSRFGSPFSFVVLTENLWVLTDPRRVQVFTQHGAFELQRVGLNLFAYLGGFQVKNFLPNFTLSHYDMIGPPRSVMLAQETALLLLAALGIKEIFVRSRDNEAWIPLAGAAVGSAVTGLLVLGAPVINYRYELDFQPFLSLAAVTGYLHLSRTRVAPLRKWMVSAFAILVAGNIAFSHADLLRAKLTSGSLDDNARARVFSLTYPVSTLLVF